MYTAMDTVNNIESTGCFVYNAVPYDLKEQMNITASGFAPEEDEFEKAGLHKAEFCKSGSKASSRITPSSLSVNTCRPSVFPGLWQEEKVLWI